MTKSREITYQRKGDYLFPNLVIESSPVSYGRYGMLRRQFLKENRKSWYQSMLLSGKLDSHLKEIDQRANEQMEETMRQMAKIEGVTEKLKADDPLNWVARMNNIQNRAEEIVLTELIYN